MSCSCVGVRSDHGIVIPVGVDYGYRWPVVTPDGDLFDLSGWTAKMQIRNRPLPSGVLRATFTTGDALTVGDGFVALALEDADTAGWTWPQGVYDIHLWTPSSEGPFFLAGGPVSTVPAVTEGSP